MPGVRSDNQANEGNEEFCPATAHERRGGFRFFPRNNPSTLPPPLARSGRGRPGRRRRSLRRATGMSTNRTTVLFVDDDVGFLDGVRNLMTALSEGTWDVLVASDAAQGLGVIHEHKVDLLVIDVRMPVMDGLQVHLVL